MDIDSDDNVEGVIEDLLDVYSDELIEIANKCEVFNAKKRNRWIQRTLTRFCESGNHSEKRFLIDNAKRDIQKMLQPIWTMKRKEANEIEIVHKVLNAIRKVASKEIPKKRDRKFNWIRRVITKCKGEKILNAKQFELVKKHREHVSKILNDI